MYFFYQILVLFCLINTISTDRHRRSPIDDDDESVTTNGTTSTDSEDLKTLFEQVDRRQLCNSERIKRIIIDNISDDAEQSKVSIHASAKARLGGHYGVICSEGSFTYLIETDHYCIHGNQHVTCYVFQV